MANFQLTLAKGPNGEILVYGNHQAANKPLFVERVNIVELDTGGNAVFASSHPVSRTFDPGVQSSALLVSTPPSGTNIKAARATAYYIEYDGIAQSNTLNL